MAKHGGKNFLPGNCANPLGGRAHSPELRAARKLTNAQLYDVAEMVVSGNLKALETIVRDPESSVLKVWIAKAAAKGIKDGNLGPLEIILNRVLGKPKETVDIGVTNSREELSTGMTKEQWKLLHDQRQKAKETK